MGGTESDGPDGCAGGVDGGRGIALLTGWRLFERRRFRGGWGPVLFLGWVDGGCC